MPADSKKDKNRSRCGVELLEREEGRSGRRKTTHIQTHEWIGKKGTARISKADACKKGKRHVQLIRKSEKKGEERKKWCKIFAQGTKSPKRCNRKSVGSARDRYLMYYTAKEKPAIYAMLVVKSREGIKKKNGFVPQDPGGYGHAVWYRTRDPILSIRRKPL